VPSPKGDSVLLLWCFPGTRVPGSRLFRPFGTRSNVFRTKIVFLAAEA
jgi:hypothetical protein